jgi:hypothetical protein
MSLKMLKRALKIERATRAKEFLGSFLIPAAVGSVYQLRCEEMNVVGRKVYHSAWSFIGYKI